MSDLAIREPPRVLIPVEVLEGQTVPESLVRFLAPAEVIVLGYHVLPEQTPAEQASMQFEDRAQAAVSDIAATFAGADREVETRVVFTHDRDQTVQRVAEEVGATAILLPNPTGEIHEVVVPLRGQIDRDRLADLVATLLSDGESRVSLWGLAPEADTFDAETAVEDARDALLDRGIDADRIDAETAATDDPVRAIVERSGEFDIIVMGEGGDTPLAVLFGDATERVAEGAVAPVLVVRSQQE